MSDLQRTIPGCGLDPVVPPARLPDDEVICEDGWICKHKDAHYDSAGGAWGDPSLRDDRDVELVTEFLMGMDEWVTEYATGNTDYPSMYDCCVSEGHHNWSGRIKEWVEDNLEVCEDYVDHVVEYICTELAGYEDWEWEYSRNEYSCYSGPHCCIDSVEIGEYEDQIEINEHSVLAALHEDGRLDSILDNVNCDVHVYRQRRRVQNKETGRYEYTGAETYDPYGRETDHPTLTTYHSPGGQWHAVVFEDRMNELVEEFFEDEDGWV